ncbi:MAG: putative Ig domain-containing protein [Chloroflexota bacterium]
MNIQKSINHSVSLFLSIFFLLYIAVIIEPSPAMAQGTCAALPTNAYYEITAKHSGQVLTVSGASQSEGAQVIQMPDTSGTEQRWHLEDLYNGDYQVFARHSGRALSIFSFSYNDGAAAEQANPSNNSNDDWCFQDTGGGEYNIVVRHSGKALTVENGSLANGADVVQMPLDPNADHQKWILSSLPPEGPGSGLGNLSYGQGQVSRTTKLMLDFPVNAGNPYGINNGVMTNGHLVGVFAPDHGSGFGGLDVYNVSDPHLPQLVGRVHDTTGLTSRFRETHSIGTANFNGGNYVIFNNCCGLEIWDIQNPQNPSRTGFIDLPELGFGNYSNNAWQLFVQAPYVYVGGAEKGLYVVDISTPTAPQLIKWLPISATGGFRIGPVFALGNRLIISSMGFPSVDGFSILDIDDPTDPQLIFSLPTVPEYYTICTNGTLLAFANTSNSVQHIYDISGDNATLLSNQIVLNDPQYCAFQDQYIFWGAETIFKVDITDPTNPILVDEMGFNVFFPDHSQVAPMGNIVWAGNDHGTGNGFIVHQAAPDTTPPSIYTVNPADNDTGVSRCSPIGIAFSDYIDLETVDNQSFIVRPVGGQAVSGLYSSMGSMVNFVPDTLLQPSTTYEIVLPSGGIKDIMGNGLNGPVSTTFTTAQNSGCDSETNPPLTATLDPISPHTVNSSVGFAVNVVNNTNPNPEVSWDFGDGNSTGFSTSTTTNHTYSAPGHYQLIATVRDGTIETTATALVTIHYPITSQQPTRSRVVAHSGTTIFVVNQDNDTLTAISESSLQKQWEVATGDQPRSVAIAPDGDLWVANELSDTVTIHSSANGAILSTITLDYGSGPFGIVFSPDGASAYLSLYGAEEVIKLNLAGSVIGQQAVATPRGIALSADSNRLLVTRFISPDTGGEVVELNSSTMNVVRTFNMAPDTTTQDSDSAARGIANYLHSVTIAPDGLDAWVGAKKDNIFRGTVRDGQPLTFETTVRALSAELDLVGNSERLSGRIDYDNMALPGGIAFTPLGDYAFVALEGNNVVSIRDRFTGVQVGELVVGNAPDDLVLSPDGSQLYIHNFLSRSVTVYDVTGFRDSTNFTQVLLGTIDTVSNEQLSAQVLQGKQIFYSAADPRMTNQGYISCAVCHIDGGHDGRTWDLTQLGEGFRNTIDLNGRSGMGHGLLHWSGNFDEVQDFENQIRDLQGGVGFMTTADFNATQDPLGSPKSGLSAELDALAAYVSSLGDSGRSPYRSAGGALTSQGTVGRTVFENNDCVACHLGDGYTDSFLTLLHDIGTIQPTSGNRLGGPLTGLDTPTLRGLWESGPYLHDGSAATLADAVNAHSGVSFSGSEMNQLVAFLQQIDESEPAPSAPQNNAPTITDPGDQTSTTFDTINLSITATDPDSDPLTFSATGLPAGLNMDTNTGLISGIANPAGTFNVTISVNDGNGGTDSANFVWTISGVTGQILWELWNTNYGLTLDTLRNDPDFPQTPAQSGYLASFASAVNQGDTFGQRISGLVYPPITGQYTFWIASDDQGELWLSTDSSLANLALIANVVDYTLSPTEWFKYAEQQSAPITLQAGQGYYIEALAQEGASGDHLAVAWQIPGGSLEVIDGQYLTPPPNNLPVARADSVTLLTDTSKDINVLFNDTDADGDTLSVESVTQPANGIVSINGNQTIQYIPNPSFIGSDSFDYTVDDGKNGQSTATVTVIVSDTAPPAFGPTGEILWERWDTAFGIVLDILRNDPDFPDSPDQSANISSFSSAINQGENFGQRIHGLIYPPITGQYIFWIASDDQGELWLSSDETSDNLSLIANVIDYTLSPNEWGKYPEQQSALITLQAGQAYYIDALAQEGGGGDHLTVAWQIPGDALRLIDGQYLSPPVAPPTNQPPTLVDPGNQSGTAGQAAALTLSASDPEGDTLTFSATGLPAGLTLDTISGQISGTPTTAEVAGVVITVDDGNGGTDSTSFTWTISDPPQNQPPTIVSISNQSNLVGDSVTLSASASDPEEDTLTFSATGLPAGLTLNSGSGQISGALATAEVANVVITVDDGNGGTDSTSFTWMVEAPSVQCIGLIQEAEDAQLAGDFVIGVDSAASNGQFIRVPSGSGNQWNGPSEDRADFCFNVPTDGTYRLVGTIFAKNGGDNSFYVMVDNQPTNGYLWDTAIDSANFITDYANQRGGADPLEFTLTAGNHTVAVFNREAGTILDKLELEPVNVDPPATCGGLEIEAEDGTLSGSFITGNDASASGGQYVHLPNQIGNNQNGTGSADKGVYCFTVPTNGTYLLEGTVFANGGGNNSFFVTVNDAPTAGYIWDTAIDSSNYIQDYINARGVADPLQLNLTAGEHTITIYPREDGTRLDKLTLIDMATVAFQAGIGSVADEDQSSRIFGTVWVPSTVQSEPKLTNLKITAVDKHSGVIVAEAATSHIGKYFIENLPAGTYQVQLEIRLADGSSNVQSKSVTVGEGGMAEASFERFPESSSKEVPDDVPDAVPDNVQGAGIRIFIPIVSQ